VLGAVVAWIKALLAWWQQTRPARANARFGAAGGGVLTGGIAYSALFSVFAGLTIGFTVFMAVLGSNAVLRHDVLATVSTSIPGLIDTGDGKGLLKPADLVLSATLNVAGAIALWCSCSAPRPAWPRCARRSGRCSTSAGRAGTP